MEFVQYDKIKEFFPNGFHETDRQVKSLIDHTYDREGLCSSCKWDRSGSKSFLTARQLKFSFTTC